MAVLKNARHEAFAQALAKGKSQVEAYSLAGYKPNDGHAARLAGNGRIANRVTELQHNAAGRAEVTVARVLKELSRLGFSDIRSAFDERGNLLPPDQWDDAFAASVASIEVVTRELPGSPKGKGKRGARVEYIHKIKAWDKNSALEKIARHLGMFVDRIEHSGPSGGPIQTETRTWREVLRQERKD